MKQTKLPKNKMTILSEDGELFISHGHLANFLKKNPNDVKKCIDKNIPINGKSYNYFVKTSLIPKQMVFGKEKQKLTVMIDLVKGRTGKIRFKIIQTGTIYQNMGLVNHFMNINGFKRIS